MQSPERLLRRRCVQSESLCLLLRNFQMPEHLADVPEAGGDYTRQRIEPYQERLRERFGLRPGPRSETMLSGFAATLLPSLFNMPWFVRHLLLDRWFLRAHEPPLAILSA